MIEVAVEPGGRDTSADAFAACLASLLEVDVGEVAKPTLAGGLVIWGQWLAERGLSLVRVADPSRFTWAGHWIAVLAETQLPVIMFGVPSGVVWDPLGRIDAGAEVTVTDGFVLASFEPHATCASAGTPVGVVQGLYIAPEKGAPMTPLDAVRALPGHGLEGDRYAAGTGTFSIPGGRGNEVTLIESEALRELRDRRGIALPDAEARRNVVTEGIALDELVGHCFCIGEVQLVGRRRCEPCAHLQRLTRPGVLRGLVHRGGLRADLLTPGRLEVGNRVERIE